MARFHVPTKAETPCYLCRVLRLEGRRLPVGSLEKTLCIRRGPGEKIPKPSAGRQGKRAQADARVSAGLLRGGRTQAVADSVLGLRCSWHCASPEAIVPRVPEAQGHLLASAMGRRARRECACTLSTGRVVIRPWASQSLPGYPLPRAGSQRGGGTESQSLRLLLRRQQGPSSYVML